MKIASIAAVLCAAGLMLPSVSQAQDVHEQLDIRIFKSNSGDTQVTVNANGEVYEMALSDAQIRDRAALDAMLADLPEDIRKHVIAALNNKPPKPPAAPKAPAMVIGSDGENRVLIHTGHSEIVEMDIESDGRHSKKIKVISLDNDGDTTLKGHTDAIVKLISMGEFSQEELDEIQAALDKKR